MKTEIVLLPVKEPDVIRAGSDWSETHEYVVIDQRPKVGEWYINMHMAPSARSIQKHRTIKHLINHKKDYRFRYCCKVISSTNPNFPDKIR